MKPWGKSTLINLHGCDAEKIRDEDVIRNFVIELCTVLEMEPFGQTHIERFGKDDLEGYSVMQFIQTSCITAHLEEKKNRAFIDIFSCKEYDSEEAADFCQAFFDAKKAEVIVEERD